MSKNEEKRKGRRRLGKGGGRASRTPPKPGRTGIVACPRCGKAMMLASQGLKWRSYACRTCGVGRIEPSAP